MTSLFLFFAALLSPSFANDVEFIATVDRAQISKDESVSLKFEIRAGGFRFSLDSPTYDAPDFDEPINSFRSSFMEMVNGQMTNRLQITHVLRPLKTGKLKIENIQVEVGGKVYKAPPVEVTVVQGGQATPPPPRRGSGSGFGLRGSKNNEDRSFFVRAEINKDVLYSGEQVIVSYYLYKRASVFNISVLKYPTLEGFLREDLEMPVVTRQLRPEAVIYDGNRYDRILLVRYAAYPVKTGELKIDPMQIQASYQTGDRDDEDIQDPFFQFFQRMTPRTSTQESRPLTVKVKALPVAGRPSGFSGAVGDFTVISAVDKYDVKVNEPITVTVKVEGRGNLEALKEPQVVWPDGIESYETKAKVKNGQGGVGEKIFEILLIPRKPGKYNIPEIPFSFFNPESEKYVTRSTQGFSVNVTGTADPSYTKKGLSEGGAETNTSQSSSPDFNSLMNSESGFLLSWWKWAVALGGVVAFLLAFVFGFHFYRKARDSRKNRKIDRKKLWDGLSIKVKSVARNGSRFEVADAYQKISERVEADLDEQMGVQLKSVPRWELREHFQKGGKISPEKWRKIEEVFDEADRIRFSSSSGVVESEGELRKKLRHNFEEIRKILSI